jgi:hypothetical protein
MKVQNKNIILMIFLFFVMSFGQVFYTTPDMLDLSKDTVISSNARGVFANWRKNRFIYPEDRVYVDDKTLKTDIVGEDVVVITYYDTIVPNFSKSTKDLAIKKYMDLWDTIATTDIKSANRSGSILHHSHGYIRLGRDSLNNFVNNLFTEMNDEKLFEDHIYYQNAIGIIGRNLDGKIDNNVILKEIEQKHMTPPNPTKEGYYFVGWYTSYQDEFPLFKADYFNKIVHPIYSQIKNVNNIEFQLYDSAFYMNYDTLDNSSLKHFFGNLWWWSSDKKEFLYYHPVEDTINNTIYNVGHDIPNVHLQYLKKPKHARERFVRTGHRRINLYARWEKIPEVPGPNYQKPDPNRAYYMELEKWNFDSVLVCDQLTAHDIFSNQYTKVPVGWLGHFNPANKDYNFAFTVKKGNHILQMEISTLINTSYESQAVKNYFNELQKVYVPNTNRVYLRLSDYNMSMTVLRGRDVHFVGDVKPYHHYAGMVKRNITINWEYDDENPFVFNKMPQAPRAFINTGIKEYDTIPLIVTNRHRDVGFYTMFDQSCAMVTPVGNFDPNKIAFQSTTRNYKIIKSDLEIVQINNVGSDTIVIDEGSTDTIDYQDVIETVSASINISGFHTDTITGEFDDESVLNGEFQYQFHYDGDEPNPIVDEDGFRTISLTIIADSVRARNYVVNNKTFTIKYKGAIGDLPTAIVDKPNKNNQYGIFFKNNIVSEPTEFIVLAPEKIRKVNFVVYDNIGNIVYSGNDDYWDLNNRSGRKVSSGLYIVVAEVEGYNGTLYHYSAKLGVK